jgi:hypothetical protein
LAPGTREALVSKQPGPFPIGPFARVGDLGPTNAIRSPELGRSPFWDRPSRALPDPEEMPASDPSRPPVGSTKALASTAGYFSRLHFTPCTAFEEHRVAALGALEEAHWGATLGCACWPSMKVPELADCPVLVLMRPA